METKKKWSAKVDTDSTHPHEGLFKKGPSAIAKALASKKVSPKGPASGMRMLNFYINRAGKNLPEERKASLKKAKTILSKIISDQKERSDGTKSPPAKRAADKKMVTNSAKKTSAKKNAAKKTAVRKKTAKKSA